MYYKRALAVIVGSVYVASTGQAKPFSTDARSMAMGNTGVVSADFLTAPFHNPALGAEYREEDDFGLLLPAVGANVQDKDDAINLVMDTADYADDIGDSDDSDELAKLNDYLDQLSEARPIHINGGIDFAIAIPNKYASANVFAAGYAELVGTTEIGDEEYVPDRYDNAKIKLTGFGLTEVGIALSREFTIYDQRFSFGVSPKLQTLHSYSYIDSFDDFEPDDIKDSAITRNAFNMDLGGVWYKDHWRVGLVAKNILKQSIDSMYGGMRYTLSPTVTLGGGYITRLFNFAVDVDLTSQQRFDIKGDETQFIRAGIEFNAWDWAQLRLGYESDLENNLEDSITAGIGISPWDVVSFDIAGSYAGKGQFGASTNLALTF